MRDKRDKNQRRSGQGSQPEFQLSFRQSHPVKLGNADGRKQGKQAGKQQRTTLQNGQDDDWEQDER
jgi:hypothetical protein